MENICHRCKYYLKIQHGLCRVSGDHDPMKLEIDCPDFIPVSKVKDLRGDDKIRWWRGKYKCKILGYSDPRQTLIELLEPAYWKIDDPKMGSSRGERHYKMGEVLNIPTRSAWKNKKKESEETKK